MNSMKVVLINNLYKPYARGGAEKIVEDSVHAFRALDNEVVVISTAPNNERRDNEEERVYYLKSVFFNLKKIPFVFRFFYHIFDSFNFINCLKVEKILKKENPDLVLTHNLKGLGFLIPRVLKKLEIKHIHTLHDIQLLHPSGLMFKNKERIINTIHAQIYQKINKLLFASPDLVVAPSKWLMDLYKSKEFFKNSKKVVLLNPSSFKREEKEYKEKDIFTFLYVGQVEEHKGVMFLVKAFIELLKKLDKDKKVELIIIGPGSQIDKIKKITKKYNNIEILGKRNTREVKMNMKKSDCLIIPSLCYENSPTVIYEAASCSLPVLASKIGGIPELIDRFGGILFNPSDYLDLTEKMEFIIKYPEKLKMTSLKEENSLINSPRDYIDQLLRQLA